MELVPVVLCVVALTQAQQRNHVQIVRYENYNRFYTFKWGFQIKKFKFKTSHDQQGEVKNQGSKYEALAVNGKYSWAGPPDSVTYTINYTAKDNGYQPVVEQGPGGAVPPSVVATLLG